MYTAYSGTANVKKKDREADYMGINGETAWILVYDHFSRRLHGDTRMSKASPLGWLRHFLEHQA